MATLNWQIGNRTKSYKDIVRGWPLAVAGPLSDTEVEAWRLELSELTRTSFAHRALLSFMNCLAHQTF